LILEYGRIYAMETLDLDSPYGKAVATVIAVIFGVLIFQSFIADTSKNEFKPEPDQACEGTPIEVTYPYYGGMLQPHACKPQCDDGLQHYILYTNGKATQCQKIPGCLDWGEDQGVTCIPE
jgi:hypothetical protein